MSENKPNEKLQEQNVKQEAKLSLQKLAENFIKADLGENTVIDFKGKSKKLDVEGLERIYNTLNYSTTTETFQLIRQMAEGKITEKDVTKEELTVLKKFSNNVVHDIKIKSLNKLGGETQKNRLSGLNKVFEPLLDKVEESLKANLDRDGAFKG